MGLTTLISITNPVLVVVTSILAVWLQVEADIAVAPCVWEVDAHALGMPVLRVSNGVSESQVQGSDYLRSGVYARSVRCVIHAIDMADTVGLGE